MQFGFYFYRNHFACVLHHKIHFCTAILRCPVVYLHIVNAAHLLQCELLGQSAFVLQKQLVAMHKRICVQSGHRSMQTNVKRLELEGIGILKPAQRNLA